MGIAPKYKAVLSQGACNVAFCALLFVVYDSGRGGLFYTLNLVPSVVEFFSM